MFARNVVAINSVAKSAVVLLVLAAPSARTEATESLLPTSEEAQKVCAFVAAIEKHEVGHYFLRRGYLDINNDGTPELVKQGMTGTMGGDALEFTARDGSPLRIEPQGFEWKDYWTHGEALIPFGRKVYLAHFDEEDLLYPSYLSYITPRNTEHVVCEFSNSVIENVGFPSEELTFCKALLSKQPEAVPFEDEHNLTYKSIGCRSVTDLILLKFWRVLVA